MRISLSEHWTLSGAGFRVEALRLPLSIPRALADAGVIGRGGAGLQELNGEWIYRRRWTLETSVDLQQFTYERAILSLPGLCGRGEIYVDGEWAASFDSASAMGGAAEIEVTASIARGRCEVAVVFAPGEGSAPFGLDAGAQLRGVSMLRLREGCILAGDTALRAFWKVEPYVPGNYVFRYAFEQAGHALGSIELTHHLSPVPATIEHLLDASQGFEDVVRWREGTDNAPLHVRLLVTRQGEACDAALLRTGFRHIERTHPAPGLSACVSGVDGRHAALYGACYAPQPLDAGETVVRQARAAGMTALYVLSRASDAFYDACDAQGMMVFQELPLQETEAEHTLRAIGAHPCIVQWGCAPVAGAQGRTADMAHPAIAPLPRLLNRMADERPFAGSAPSSASPLNADAPGRGAPLHAAGPEYPLGPDWTARYFNQDTAPYRTMLMPALLQEKALFRAAGDQRCWPAQESQPLWTHRGGIWPPAERTQVRDFLGEDVWDDVGQLCRLTRLWQAESVRYAIEQARFREAFGLFALRLGAEKTYLSDDVLIEADGSARPAYYAFAHAMRPVHVCARLDRTGYWADTRFEAFVRVVCDAPKEETATIEAALYRADGTALVRESFACTLKTGEYGCIRTQLPDEPGALVLRLTLRAGEQVLDASDQILCVGLTGALWPLAHLTGTMLRLHAGVLENAGAFTAFGVSAPGLGWRCLLPGERVAYDGAQEQIECMNAFFTEGQV